MWCWRRSWNSTDSIREKVHIRSLSVYFAKSCKNLEANSALPGQVHTETPSCEENHFVCVCACVLQRSLISWVNRFFALQPANKGTFREGLFLCVVGLCWLLYLFQKQLPPQYLKVAWGAKRQGLHFFCTAWWFTKGARFCFGWYGACPAIAETDSLVLSKHEPTLTLPRQR